ncbi:tyrosine-type recombinase/integrase [Actinophytocola gossypii]|uniref:tyrosine-type recombinase/integrase n=1 Tax=Actinophytocola gossypii TaxID=2812003 RepID=UPI0035CCF4DC
MGQVRLAPAQPHPPPVRGDEPRGDQPDDDQSLGQDPAAIAGRTHRDRRGVAAVHDPVRGGRRRTDRRQLLPTTAAQHRRPHRTPPRHPTTDTRPHPPDEPQRRTPRAHRRLHRDAVGRTRRTAVVACRPRHREDPHQPGRRGAARDQRTPHPGKAEDTRQRRTIHLPRFLVDRLHTHRQDSGKAQAVFAAADGGWHRRSNFRRRVWLPAVNGNQARGWTPLAPGLHFHDLRHTHKTWLIEDGVPEVLQHQRLGHRLDGIRGVYSHVTPAMVDAMLTGLQTRWEQIGSRNTGDPYQTTKVVKISCSQNAPTDAKQPTGDDHQRAV